jgi:hypothetical protein
MKKIYLLSLLCLIGFSSFAQSTATIYATGGPGSYITATTDGTTRTEDNIVTGNVPPLLRRDMRYSTSVVFLRVLRLIRLSSVFM